mmetsp:Transcript_39657/g.113080  ORF Transcript_39657/g.113080 Transcript_39657/m.113080 type:complete len:227 (+) Transcript_39657:2419-3099(+)
MSSLPRRCALDDPRRSCRRLRQTPRRCPAPIFDANRQGAVMEGKSGQQLAVAWSCGRDDCDLELVRLFKFFFDDGHAVVEQLVVVEADGLVVFLRISQVALESALLRCPFDAPFEPSAERRRRVEKRAVVSAAVLCGGGVGSGGEGVHVVQHDEGEIGPLHAGHQQHVGRDDQVVEASHIETHLGPLGGDFLIAAHEQSAASAPHCRADAVDQLLASISALLNSLS